jgi:hypothetical protein
VLGFTVDVSYGEGAAGHAAPMWQGFGPASTAVSRYLPPEEARPRGPHPGRRGRLMPPDG